MKKYLLLTLSFVICFLCLAGCEKVNSGEYKTGTYFGYVEEESYGSKLVTTAVVYVGNGGAIESVFLDATYEKDKVLTTKKSLGDAYAMKSSSEVGKEWFEQANLIEAKVVENQGTSFITLDNDGKTDAIAGVTIKITSLVKAIDNALLQAK